MKFYKTYINTVSGGSLSINEEKGEGDIQFKVYNEYKASFMSVKKYILLSFVIIFISIISLYGSILLINNRFSINNIVSKKD